MRQVDFFLFLFLFFFFFSITRNLQKTSDGKWNNKILEAFSPSSSSGPEIYPKKFFYAARKHTEQIDNFIPNENVIKAFLPADNLISGWSLPSKQMVVGDRTFQIDDNILLNQGSHRFLQIRQFVTVRTKAGSESFVRGSFFTDANKIDNRTKKSVHSLSPAVGDWIPAKRMERVIAVNHHCTRCVLKRTCNKHGNAACPLVCPYYDLSLEHSDTNEFIIDEHFRLLV